MQEPIQDVIIGVPVACGQEPSICFGVLPKRDLKHCWEHLSVDLQQDFEAETYCHLSQ